MQPDAFLHGEYWSPMPSVAPKYYRARGRGHGRLDMPRMAKLTSWDIAEIRRWVRAEGFALAPKAQIDWLCERTFMSRDAIRDVVNNESFHDPAYDRNSPLPKTSEASPHWLFYCPRWVWMFLLWHALQMKATR